MKPGYVFSNRRYLLLMYNIKKNLGFDFMLDLTNLVAS